MDEKMNRTMINLIPEQLANKKDDKISQLLSVSFEYLLAGVSEAHAQ